MYSTQSVEALVPPQSDGTR